MALPTMSAAPTNTYIESTAPNVREDLRDIIAQIDPVETPLLSNIGSAGSSQVLTEWLLQELNPAANVPQPEGFTAAISPAKKPVRLNNICQILARTVGVSDTLRVVDQVGEEEYSRQLMMRGQELRRDVELMITGETVGGKALTDPRASAGLLNYVSHGSVGAGTGAFPVGDGSNAHTAGTARDLTLQMVLDAMQASYDLGGKPRLGLTSSSVRKWFTQISAASPNPPVVAQNVLQATQAEPITLIAATAVFLTDFGRLELAIDRFMPPHVFELIDPDQIEMAPLPQRDFIEESYAKTGDNTQGGVVFEGTIRVLAPKAHAAIWDLNQ